MSSLPTTGRLQWVDVPAPLRQHLEHVLDGSITATTPSGGFGHQLAAVLTSNGRPRAFVKAAPAEDTLTTANLHEAAVLAALPPCAPAPALLGTHHMAGWTAVLFEHLDGPHPDLSSDGDDASSIWALLDKLTSSPAPDPYVEAVRTSTPSVLMGLHGWAELAADPPPDLPALVRAHLSRLVELEQAWPALARGDRIVHGDLRADNMVRDAHRGVTFVDWAHATTGPACIDAASLAPQLVLAGHVPADVARLLTQHPATSHQPDTTSAFLASLTGHWQRNARKPAPPGAPGLRPYQHAAAAAGLALLDHRLGKTA